MKTVLESILIDNVHTNNFTQAISKKDKLALVYSKTDKKPSGFDGYMTRYSYLSNLVK